MEKNSDSIELWLKLIRAEGVGPKTFVRLMKKFGSIEDVMAAGVRDLEKVEKIGRQTAEKIARSRENFDTQRELELADKLGVCVINMDDERYPASLSRIYDPPPVLYVKGTLEKSDALSVAIVGSRRCSTYGSEQSSRFAHMLASSGFAVISGMARGIDTAAHRGAISAKGRTIAVQGCGLKNIFPPENDKLFEMIAESGACVSELPLEYEPLSENFPARNRIIAGIAMGSIVIEAHARSGALITAKCSLEHNREVMAVPGKIDSPLSVGAHRLIKQGARLIDSVEDVMETLGYIGQGLKSHAADASSKAEANAQMPLFDVADLNLSKDERSVYDAMDGDALHVEQVIGMCDVPAGKVNSSLISLRLKGLVKQLPGNMFKKN